MNRKEHIESKSSVKRVAADQIKPASQIIFNDLRIVNAAWGWKLSWQEVGAGVPQGSILRPVGILFNLSMKDLVDVIKNCDLSTYDNDTQLSPLRQNQTNCRKWPI